MASNCPSCAAPLAFRPGTMVSVCKACGSLCARTDRDPELIGKVAALVDTGSPLAVGATGRFAGRAFTVAGRIQMAHPLGGVWDEWYLALDDGRWGWLAEAQGRFLLIFRHPAKAPVPPFEALEAGRQLDLGEEGRWAIQEASDATVAGAEGEIPWRPALHEAFRFADLSGPHGAFATLDYSEMPPALYLGREVPFSDLHLQGVDAPPPTATRRDLALNCPKCGGPLKLRAPDQTQRVACPSCNALLDCAEGKFRFLRTLQQPNARMAIPLGQEGTLRGRKVTCVGHMVRACTVDGVEYPWGEYLLLTADHGFLWLVESEGHWSLAEGIPAGEAPQGLDAARSFSWKGGSYRRFQDVTARVKGVWGEFTWKVEQGEKAEIAEWVAPPHSLSLEVQKHQGGGAEANWTLSTYLEPGEVKAAFGLPGALPPPAGVGSFQPNPHKAKLATLGTWMALALLALLGLIMVQSLTHRAEVVWAQDVDLLQAFPQLGGPAARGTPLGTRPRPGAPSPQGPAPAEPQEPVLIYGPLDLHEGRKNLAFTIEAPVENQWIGVEGALVNEESGEVEAFEVASSWYHGVDDGESWSEGSRKETVYLSALPPGKYMLRLAPQWDGTRPPVNTVAMSLRSGVMHWPYIGLAFLAIVLGPVLLLFKVMAFEGRRWQESMYATSGSSDSDD